MRNQSIGFLVVAVVVFGIPALVFLIQARHTGLSLGQQWQQLWRRGSRNHDESSDVLEGTTAMGEPVPFLSSPLPIGVPAGPAPQISSVRVADLDEDGLNDVLVCDALANRVSWIRQSPLGTFQEQVIEHEIPAPAHVEAYDVDQDGDRDLLVASMGMIFPNNDHIGAIVVLENNGSESFTPHFVEERIARVTDLRAGDLDGDGDIDLVAGQFGYDDGEIRWLENQGEWKFVSQILLRLSGTVHTPVADMDGDGDLDIVALVTQEWEETYLFENRGGGEFVTRVIYGSTNEDFGSSGIDLVDMDQDGDLDVLYTNGDAFDYMPPRPRPWHGLQWLENVGNGEYVFHRIANFPGASVARAADFDGDGDLDVAVSSAYNQWEREDAYSLAWLENTGALRFILRPLARSPTHLIALDVGDLNSDGRPDMVTGGMHVYPPNDRISRVSLWYNQWDRLPETRDGQAGQGRRP